jgi:hypothetical protein
MWLSKSFGMRTSLVLDMAKAKLNRISIFLAKGAMKLWFHNMSFKEVKSTLAT